MRNRLPIAFVAALAVLAVGGCSCDTPPTADIVPVPVAAPMAVNYGEQCNESQRVEKITFTNSTGGNLSMALSIVGNDAGFFTVEPTNLSLQGSGASGTVDVTYHPSDELGGGSSQLGARHQAILRATYAGPKDQTAALDIELGGEVARTTVAPKISFTCLPDGDGVAPPRCSQNPNGVPCCSTYDPGDGSRRFETLGFGSPRIGDTAVLPLRVENLGCAPLAVESIVLNTQVSTCGPGVVPPLEELAFSLEQGASHDFSIRFTPETECHFSGQLVVTPEEGNPAKATVQGNGRESKLRVSDTEFAFGEVVPGQIATREFAIRNWGQVPVDVSKITLVNDLAPDALDFTFSMEKEACVDGAPSGVRTPFALGGGYTFAPSDAIANCGDDEVFVKVVYQPSQPGMDKAHIQIESEDGVLRVELKGGTYSQIGHEPAQVRFGKPRDLCTGGDDFSCDRAENQCQTVCMNDGQCANGERCHGATATVPGTCFNATACAVTCGESTNTVRIVNKGFAPLEVTGLRLTNTSGGPAPKDPNGWDIFTVGAETCRGTLIAKDDHCTVQIKFRDTNVGGYSAANLQVLSNDPSVDGEYFIEISSNTQIDLAPRPLITQTPAASFAVVGGWIRLDASPSTDDREVGTFKWRLTGTASGASKLFDSIGTIDPANPNANCPAIYGECFRFPFGRNTPEVIEFRPDIVGAYGWALTVSDVGCAFPHEAVLNHSVTVSDE